MFRREISILALVSALVCAVSAQDRTEYFKLGGSLTVRPKSVPPNIADITWKCNGDVVAEYFPPAVSLAYLGRFRGHASLDVNTGELRLSNMAAEHAGRYSVEINSQIHSDGTRAVLIQEVPAPQVETEPLACTEVMNQCSLVCRGDVAKAGPVSYSWRRDGGGWTQGGEKLNISKSDSEAIQTFSCKLENPVSSQESRPFQNPFFIPPHDGPDAGVVVGVTTGMLLLLAVAAGGVTYWKRDFLFKRKNGQKNENANANEPESLLPGPPAEKTTP